MQNSFISVHRSTHHSIRFQIRKLRLSISIRNFGKYGEIKLMIEGRKISGGAMYSGGPFSFSAALRPNGKWTSRFSKRTKKAKITFSITEGRISSMKSKELMRNRRGYSNVIIHQDRDSGYPKESLMRIKLVLSPTNKVSGFIKHTSNRHHTTIDLRADGTWEAKGWVRLLRGRFAFSAQKGRSHYGFKGLPILIPTSGSNQE